MTGAASLSGSILPALTSSSVASHCRDHRHRDGGDYDDDDIVSGDTRSMSTRSSATSIASTISGSGLLFLKNYLSKKKQQKVGSQGRQSAGTEKREAKHMNFFNSTPMPFPPPRDHYGPVFVKDNDGEDCGGGGCGRAAEFFEVSKDSAHDPLRAACKSYGCKPRAYVEGYRDAHASGSRA